ncbi:hypothetical protein BC941DRAFT_477489 [Chlamydoabsidia padenii]|nr:hypothetical protein BC941DRAFT_477489 [Chlamydoabsidia padenii]
MPHEFLLSKLKAPLASLASSTSSALVSGSSSFPDITTIITNDTMILDFNDKIELCDKVKTSINIGNDVGNRSLSSYGQS